MENNKIDGTCLYDADFVSNVQRIEIRAQTNKRLLGVTRRDQSVDLK
jgi:hypothetical protein